MKAETVVVVWVVVDSGDAVNASVILEDGTVLGARVERMTRASVEIDGIVEVNSIGSVTSRVFTTLPTISDTTPRSDESPFKEESELTETRDQFAVNELVKLEIVFRGEIETHPNHSRQSMPLVIRSGLQQLPEK